MMIIQGGRWVMIVCILLGAQSYSTRTTADYKCASKGCYAYILSQWRHA